ncbi:hypothetical protein C8R45DRAFT_974351 [Mycena sanguinolenta]|nr:hypothetical protein C8R45DRAFT_974351 [Mycena sanguinolenta]
MTTAPDSSYIACRLLAAFKSRMLIALAFLVPQLVFVSVFFPAPRLRCRVCICTAAPGSHCHSVRVPANRSLLARLRLLRVPHSALTRNGWGSSILAALLHDSSVAPAARPSSSSLPSCLLRASEPARPLRRLLFLSSGALSRALHRHLRVVLGRSLWTVCLTSTEPCPVARLHRPRALRSIVTLYSYFSQSTPALLILVAVCVAHEPRRPLLSAASSTCAPVQQQRLRMRF